MVGSALQLADSVVDFLLGETLVVVLTARGIQLAEDEVTLLFVQISTVVEDSDEALQGTFEVLVGSLTRASVERFV